MNLRHLKHYNLYLDSYVLSPLCRISLHIIHCASPPFCDLTWLPPKSPFSTLPLENVDEVQRCSELHRDICHYVCWIFFCTDLHQVDHLSLTYLVIPHIDVLYPLMIHVILSKINSTRWTWTESCMMPKVLTNPLNHKASLDVSTAAMYFTFVVENAFMSCNFTFQLMTHSTIVNT